MKQIPFVGLMGVLLTAIIAVPVTAQMDCPYGSYWKTHDGRCIDMTVLTNMTILNRMLAAPPVFEADGVVADGLSVYGENSLVYIKANLTNKESEPVFVSDFRYQLVQKDGTPVVDGIIFIGKNINPGQSIAISDLLTQNSLGRRVRANSLRVQPLDITF